MNLPRISRFSAGLAVVIAVAMIACATRRQVSQIEIERTLARADVLSAREQPDSAARLVNELARALPGDTVLLARAATLNSQLGSVEARRKAARAFRKLIELSPDDPRHHLNLAKILIDQTREGEARSELCRTMALAPTEEEPCLILADVYLKSFFTKEERDRADSAELVLKRLVALNPQSTAALCKLGGIEAVRGNLDSARKHIDAALANDSAAVEANLVSGYIKYQLKDFSGAQRSFERALVLLDSVDSEGYRSIEYLIPPPSIRYYRKMNAHERDSLERKFWGLADLDPTTQPNERRVEHYARVWEANLCYSDPKNDRIGWKTDMGETLIRLGRPDEKVRKRLGASMIDTSPVWFWQYRSVAYPCTLAFVDQMESGNYTFPFPNRDNTGSFRSNASKEVAYTNYLRKPEESTISRERMPIGMATDIYQFRSDSRETGVSVYLEISARDVAIERDAKVNPLSVRQALQDSTQTAIWRTDTTSTPFLAGRPAERDSFHYRLAFPSRSGNYELFTAVEQVEQNRFGLTRDTILIQDFTGDQISMSDLVLTSDSLIDPPLGIFRRSDKEDDPLPAHTLSGSTPIYLYFEIYNLPLDITRQSSYQITYTMQLVKPTESGMRSLMSRVLPRLKEAITMTLHEIGRSSDVARVLALDVSELREGDYLLTVQITDQIFNRTVSKATELLLTP